MRDFVLFVMGASFVIPFLLLAFYATRVKKVGPNQALIISGRGDPNARQGDMYFRAVVGGRTFVWPVVERVDYLSLEV